MTTPDTIPDTTPAAAEGNTDAPTATVSRFGPSEVTTYLVAGAGIADTFFGRDFGVGKSAQALGILIAGLVVLAMNVSRAIKHRAAMHANAITYAAQLEHVAKVLTAGGGTPTIQQLSQGVSALNSAVIADTAPAAKRTARNRPATT
jgi:hypothetical protein